MPFVRYVAVRNLWIYNKIKQQAFIVTISQSTVRAMEETKGVTRLANDIDFLNHVIAKHTTSSSVDSQIAGAPRTGLTDDQDAQKIAEDALTILKSFCNSQEELRKVDSDTPGRDWDGKWGRQYMVRCAALRPPPERSVHL